MVTARTKEVDELIGLEFGADDYIKKPFSPKVLVSRVKALLKRPQRIEENTIDKGDLSLNTVNRTLTKNGKIVAITSVQFNILQILMMNPGKVFERYNLIDGLHNNGDIPDIFDRTMDSHIKNIRKMIEDNPRRPQYILTVRGVGYKFNENF
ncbi:response regulator transcription factor [Candidatus Dojkabacteria bacterium]|nr:response regulator transcription factor [Candidatus Dojkabacteria bacterium]